MQRRLIEVEHAYYEERALLVLWHKGQQLVMVKKLGERDAKWWLPETRVVAGETLFEAATRLARSRLGILLPVERLSQFREQTSFNGVRRVSLKAKLSDREFETLPVRDRAGTHDICTINRMEIRRYFPLREDRLIMS